MDRLDLKCVITQLVLTLVIFYVGILLTAPPVDTSSVTLAQAAKPRDIKHDAMLYVLFGVSILIGNVLAAMLNNGCPQKSSLF
jgi:hypothetical protein